MRARTSTVLAALTLLLATPAFSDGPLDRYQTLLTPLLSGGNDVLGAPLVYPSGSPNITSAIVTIPPGGQTGWHSHEVPLFAHVLDGELTVDYGSKGTKTYRAGDSVLEAMNWPHNGTNTGTVPMRLLAVYMGSDAAKNTITTPAP